MKTISTEIEIHAPAAVVWMILTDFRAFPAWNPFVRHIEGSPAVGTRLNIVVQPQGSKEMRFMPRVLAATPNEEFRWLGRFLLPGLFDGEHIFRIHPINAKTIRFIHEEHFQGILVPLFAGNLESGSRAGFTAMNQALKARAEQMAATYDDTV